MGSARHARSSRPSHDRRCPLANAGDGHNGDGEDRDAFAREFADVKPLEGKSHQRVSAAPGVGTPRARAKEVTLSVSHERDGTVVGKRTGTHQTILEELAHPKVAVEATCDLHGFGGAEAAREVVRFVRDSHAEGKRWLLIIFGKGLHSAGGQGTLGDHVVRALSHGPGAHFVLAFHTAPGRHGGDGAFTVRLADRV